MDEGCAHEPVAQFEFTIAVRQPKHPSGPVIQVIWALMNQRLDITAKVSWTCESDDGLKVR